MTVLRPASFDLNEAWTAYQKLAEQYRDNPALAANAAFCALMARAFRHWQNLFLAEERS